MTRKIIMVTNKGENFPCFVSPQDFDYLNQFNWTLHTMGYAQANIGRKTVLMHKLILDSEEVDHIDHDKLNNTRENLRASNKSLNALNRQNTKGYFYDRKKNRYIARVKVNGKTYRAGAHKTPEEAREAYLKKRFELVGF